MEVSSLLIGRHEERERLTGVLNAATRGEKRAALVVAAPGLGKTLLVRSLHIEAQALGMLTSLVRAPAAAGLSPRFPLGDVLADLANAADAGGIPLADRLRAAADASTPFDPASIPSLAQAFERLCTARPVAIFIDDYHWAPSEGTSLLLALLRSVEAPLAVVMTARPERPDPQGSPLPDATADLWVDRIELAGLSEEETALLASSFLDGPVLPSLADALYEQTEGNPLHTIESLRYARERDVLSLFDGHWGLAATLDASPMRHTIASRIAALDEDEIRFAGALAVLGRPATVDELKDITSAGRSVADVLAGLADAGIVAEEPGGGRWRLSHPLHERAIVERLGSVRAGALHAAILEMLRARRAKGARMSASEIAHHAVRALEPPGDARDLFAAAAEEARLAGRPADAAGWYARLADIATDDGQRWGARIEQARATARIDPRAAIDVYSSALPWAPSPSERARALLGRARAHQRLAEFDQDLSDLNEARPIAAESDLFEIEDAIAVVHLLRGDRDEAERQFRDLVERTKGSQAHPLALFHLAAAMAYKGDVRALVDLSLECERICTDEQLRRSARNNALWGLMLLGRWPEAEERMWPAIREAEAAEDFWNLMPVVSNGALLYAWKGDTSRALDLAHRSEVLARRLGNPTDELKALECRGVALLEAGQAVAAVGVFGEVERILESKTEAREIDYTYLVAGESRLAIDDVDGAHECWKRAVDALTGDSLIWAASIDRFEAEIALARNDTDRAIEITRRRMADPGPVALEAARIHDTAGRATFRAGDRAEGAQLVAEACRRYEQLGALRRAGDAKLWLTAHEPRRIGRPRSAHPAGLTEREIEVLRMIVRGKNNRQISEDLFLSLSTVKKHVERILAKTGARRTELALFAMRNGLAIDE